ncbi:unnamed protein product, partial [Bubo scandiacus]
LSSQHEYIHIDMRKSYTHTTWSPCGTGAMLRVDSTLVVWRTLFMTDLTALTAHGLVQSRTQLQTT